MEDKIRENKLSIEQLVLIGDAIHNTECCFLMVKNINEEGKNDVLCCLKGQKEELKEMIYNSLIRDKTLYELVLESVLQISTENLNNLLSEFKK